MMMMTTLKMKIPTPIGCEIKNMTCAEPRIMFHLMHQKGTKENREAVGEHLKQTKSVGTIQILLAAQESNPKRCIVADSAFGSVKSALNCARNGLHCQMLVKTAHTCTPNAAIARKNLQPGESVCYVTEIEGHKLICLGWQDQTTKIFIATCGTIVPGIPHTRTYLKQNVPLGQKQDKIIQSVDIPKLANQYFNALTLLMLTIIIEPTLELKLRGKQRCG
jgi:hypothetical protein